MSRLMHLLVSQTFKDCMITTHALQGKRGGLKDTLPDDMMEAVFKATIQRTGINPAVSPSAHPQHQASVRLTLDSMVSGLYSCTPPMPSHDTVRWPLGRCCDVTELLTSGAGHWRHRDGQRAGRQLAARHSGSHRRPAGGHP